MKGTSVPLSVNFIAYSTSHTAAPAVIAAPAEYSICSSSAPHHFSGTSPQLFSLLHEEHQAGYNAYWASTTLASVDIVYTQWEVKATLKSLGARLRPTPRGHIDLPLVMAPNP